MPIGITQRRFGLSGSRSGELGTPVDGGDVVTVQRYGLSGRRWGRLGTPGESEGSLTQTRYGLSGRRWGRFSGSTAILISTLSGHANQQFGTGELLSMKKNVAGQKVGAQMIALADGSNFTGPVTAYVTGDAGTQAAGSVSAGLCTHEGNGYHTYAPAQAETNYDLIAFTLTGTGALSATVQLSTTVDEGVINIKSRLPAALTGNGNMKSSLLEILTTALTESVAGYLAAGFRYFWNVVTPAKTMNDVGGVPATVCRYGGAFTSSAGVVARFSAWLETNGQAVVLADGECTIDIRENDSGTDLFSVTSDDPTAQGIFEFEQLVPGFTADRLYIVTVTIDDGVNDPYVTRYDSQTWG